MNDYEDYDDNHNCGPPQALGAPLTVHDARCGSGGPGYVWMWPATGMCQTESRCVSGMWYVTSSLKINVSFKAFKNQPTDFK